MAADPKRVRDVLLATARLSPEARPSFLADTCGEDVELRAEVDQLLAASDESDSVLESISPAPNNATGAIVSGHPETKEHRRGSCVTTELDPDAPSPNETASVERREDWATGTFDKPDPDATTAAASASPAPQTARVSTGEGIGTIIAGRYTLAEVIGEGGMGSVYLASQSEPVKRQVALKLIKTGMDSRAVLARFDAERQALALMDHPNIARIYDGGATASGQPFFVMELVKGIPLTEYCDQKRLPVKDRLELFVQVCQAVQHAHQKGIIHRDLKPGNVLVNEVDGRPTPKVIDFGVAKATEVKLTDMSFADVGAIVGTPAYMSPEQADPTSMDIDTRTDVYALGVMLYELLTGSPPLEAKDFRRGAIHEMLRMVREVDPPRPSTKLSTAEALPNIAANRDIDPAKLAKLLQGELDWVVMKALEKDRTRRYDTANGFARDIQRYLADEVVEARPPSRGYRLKMFVKRNKVQVIAASLVLLTLVGGIIGTTLGLIEARRQQTEAWRQEKIARDEATQKELARQAEAKQRDIAEANERTAVARLQQLERSTESLIGVFRNLDPYSEEKEGLPLRAILARNLNDTADALQGTAVGDPLSVAKMQSYLGKALAGVGDYPAAVEVLERSLSSDRKLLGPDDAAALGVANELALAYRSAGRTDEALPLLIDTLARSNATRGVDDLETLACMNNLSGAYRSAGMIEKALPVYIETEAKTRAKMGPDHQATLAATNDLALAYEDLGQLDKALPLFVATLEKGRAVLGADHPFTLNTMNNLSNAYSRAGRRELSMPLLLEALAGRRAKLGPTHPDTLQSMSNLALAYLDTRQTEKAMPLLEETLAGRQARLGPDHRSTLGTMKLLAEAYLQQGQTEKGLMLLGETLPRMEAKMGKDHPDTLGLMNNLAASYWQAKQYDKSVPLFERLLPMHVSKMGPDHPLTINVQANLGVNYRDAGRLTEAIATLEDAVRRLDQHPEINVARLSWIRTSLTSTYDQAGRFEKAEAGHRRAWEAVVEKFGEDHLNSAAAASLLADNLIKQSKYEESTALLRRAPATREKGAPADWSTFNTKSLLGGALLGQKKYADAEPLLLSGYEGMKQSEKTIPPQANTRLSEAIDRLIELYTAMNKPDKVKKWQAERAKCFEAAPRSGEKK